MDWPIFTILQKGLAILHKQTSQKMDRYEPGLELEVSDKIHHQKIRLSHSYEKFMLLGFGDVTSKSQTKGKSQKIRNQSSTPTSPTSDPSVAQALQFIQSRFTDPIQVQDVAQHVGLSRRALERRFFVYLKSSPAKEIWKARLAKAKLLLQNSTCLIGEVARESGFASLEYFRTFFRSKTGLTPKKYRVQSMIGKIPPINSPDPASR
jgi:AraC-like DNA-binding protein